MRGGLILCRSGGDWPEQPRQSRADQHHLDRVHTYLPNIPSADIACSVSSARLVALPKRMLRLRMDDATGAIALDHRGRVHATSISA
jgi:hypothetical protein